MKANNESMRAGVTPVMSSLLLFNRYAQLQNFNCE